MHPQPANTLASAPLTPSWEGRKHFDALDWARDQHDIALVDIKGALALQLRYEHTLEG